MPLTLTIEVPDPPPVPHGYLLTHFERAKVTVPPSRTSDGDQEAFGNGTDGYERSARGWFAAALAGQVLRAVAWFDGVLDDSGGRSLRLASTFDPRAGNWTAWRADESPMEVSAGNGPTRHASYRPANRRLRGASANDQGEFS